MAKRKLNIGVLDYWKFYFNTFIFYKGATITSIQYIIFIFLAISGFLMEKNIKQDKSNVLK